jgi:hypothetical protein
MMEGEIPSSESEIDGSRIEIGELLAPDFRVYQHKLKTLGFQFEESLLD